MLEKPLIDPRVVEGLVWKPLHKQVYETSSNGIRSAHTELFTVVVVT